MYVSTMISAAGAFIAFIRLLQGLLQKNIAQVPKPPTCDDMVIDPPSQYLQKSVLARLRWQHPYFLDINLDDNRFPGYEDLLPGKYAWKVTLSKP